ncbi:hypothetical protein C4K23_2194 [Pseudomonas chlororaphis]|nr:hypothetical protein C4K23_2194 [Pseudomonas chlororaphis]
MPEAATGTNTASPRLRCRFGNNAHECEWLRLSDKQPETKLSGRFSI